MMHSRLKRVLIMRYWDDMTLEQIADRMGCTRERVRQLEHKALTAIRKKPELMAKLRDHLDEINAISNGGIE